MSAVRLSRRGKRLRALAILAGLIALIMLFFFMTPYYGDCSVTDMGQTCSLKGYDFGWKGWFGWLNGETLYE